MRDSGALTELLLTRLNTAWLSGNPRFGWDDHCFAITAHFARRAGCCLVLNDEKYAKDSFNEAAPLPCHHPFGRPID